MTKLFLTPIIFAALALPACSADLSMPDPHPIRTHDEAVANQPAPSPTELPPGLGPDLPPPPSTQPLTPQK